MGRAETFTVSAWLSALRDWLVDAGPVRRALFTLLLIVPFAALGGVWLALNPAEYRTLYPALSDRAGGEIIAALDQMGIPYRLSAVDGRIEVPVRAVHTARYRLAAQGLPRSDEAVRAEKETAPRFGATSQQEQQRLQRALEIELARSVETLDAVDLARVHLALPRVSPFLRDSMPATAAVLVSLKAGASLTLDQVATIQTLVAASVPRLQPSDVQVFDPAGVQFGLARVEPESARVILERELVGRVQNVLDPWLGAGRVSVQVTATLDDSSARHTVERVRTGETDGKPRPLEKIVQTTVLPEGRLARLDAIVILNFDAPREVRLRAGQLARQALGLTPARGDTLNVYVLPRVATAEADTPVVPMPPEPEGASAAPVVHTLPADVSDRDADAASGAAAIDPRLILLAGLGVLALLGIVFAMRRRPAAPPEPEDDFDSLLDTARTRTLENPRVTADVIKLWMRA